MTTPRFPKQKLGRIARAAKRSGLRPPRQPTRTLITALLWLVFMLIVWFQAPDIRLPTFFQRLVGIADALLTMLVVMFAIREYGKRFNRVPVPLMGRVSTSRIAGGIVFVAVFAWWISPWAPIPAGEPEPDLWRLLEEGLDHPCLQIVDTNLATLVPPIPSREAQQAAKEFAHRADPLRSALVAIALSRFDEAETLLNHAAVGSGADRVHEAWAQLELYRGHYATASRRYHEMLQIEPRREDFLAHGAIAAALGGDFSTATPWAQQLLEQAQARARISLRTIEAANLLATVHLLAGDNAGALRVSRSMAGRGVESSSVADAFAAPLRQDPAVVNNLAVIRLLAGSGASNGPSVTSGFALARKLWLHRGAERNQSEGSSDPHAALAFYNLGAAALYQARYAQAETILADSLTAWRQFSDSPLRIGMQINLNAISRLDLIEGRLSLAESVSREIAEPPSSSETDFRGRLAVRATAAQLRMASGNYASAISEFSELIDASERGGSGLSKDHPYAAILQLRLSDAFLQAGDNRRAQEAASESNRILEAAGLGASRSAADAMRISGLSLLRQGNREDAERRFDGAIKLLRPSEEGATSSNSIDIPATPEFAALLAAEGELAADLQNYTAADDYYRQAIAELEKVFESQAANHPLRAKYLRALGELFVREEKPAKAKPLLEESLAIDRRALPPGHPETIAAMESLASVLEKMGSAAEAKKLRDEARQLHGNSSRVP